MIDSHQHYWTIQRNDYGWLTPEKGKLYQDFLPEHLKSILSPHSVEKTIVVQAAPSVEETYYLLELAAKEPTIAGVVGWLDFEADDFQRTFHQLRTHSRFIGVRPMIQDLPDEWMLQEQVLHHFSLLADHDFPVDFQLRPRLLSAMITLLQKLPHLRGVVDHMAKPAIWSAAWQPWAAQMKAIAAYPGMMCKLSGMVPEKEGAAWTFDEIKPYASHVVELFGSERLMFGSDWPVCLLSASYDEVVRLARQTLPPHWSKDQVADVFGMNAVKFYKIRND